MSFEIPPLFYAFGATLCFAYASTIFTEFARKVSPFWMNSFKAVVALIAFWLSIVFLKTWTPPSVPTVVALLSSGAIGLMIGDIFMLHAMKELGPSRMLMIFGLQPFVLGTAGYFLFNQNFSWLNFVGVLMMLGCLYTISLESYKKNGHWQLRGMLLGFVAVMLDAIGILMTRHGFDATPGITSIQVNALRCVGAVAGFILLNIFYYPKKDRVYFRPILKTFSSKDKVRLTLAALGGTYLSLMLYLTAISRGQLSVVSSVSVTGPMFAELFECVRFRKVPSPYLFVALAFFLGGFIIFSFPQWVG